MTPGSKPEFRTCMRPPHASGLEGLTMRPETNPGFPTMHAYTTCKLCFNTLYTAQGVLHSSSSTTAEQHCIAPQLHPRTRQWGHSYCLRTLSLLTSDIVPVSLVNRVLLPTEGNPTRPTRASPTLLTSNPTAAKQRSRPWQSTLGLLTHICLKAV